MIVTINGEKKEIPTSSTVAGFLADQKIDAASVVVELNGAIISSEDFEQTALGENDSLEVLRFVGGG